MRIIDAFSGDEVRLGVWLRAPDGSRWRVIKVVVEHLTYVLLAVEEQGHDPHLLRARVRYLHPSFLFQKVAFVET